MPFAVTFVADHSGLELERPQQHPPKFPVGWIIWQFKTTSRVVIIANQWKSLNADVAALEDRGHIIHFSPTAGEVHPQAGTWFWDQEIFDFVAEHLHLLERHSLRTYRLAWELKSAGMDWNSAVLSRCLTGTAVEVARLKADPSFATEEDRVQAFIKAGHGCRATYFNHAAKLRAPEDVPKITLAHTEPPGPPAPKLDLMDALRERWGELGNG